MAISLKEQLRILNEGVHYHPPFKFGPKGFSVLKKGREDTETLKVATQMFYDFYAMELMHRLVGSPIPDPDVGNPKYAGQLTPQQKAKFKRAVQKGGEDAMGAMYVPNWADVEEPTMGGAIVPDALRRVVDQVYEEVVIHLTNKMLAHLRLTLLQEFRYLTGVKEWQQFRMRLVSTYNKNNGKISEEEFKQAIKDKIPSMEGHEDTVKRLLKFFKYSSGVTPDLTDAIPKKTEPPVEPEPEPTEPEPEEPESEPSAPEPEEPEPEMPPVEIPPGADWDDEPYKYSDEVEKAKLMHWLKTHQKISEAHDSTYAAGRISPHTISDLRQAVAKSGLTWSDILLAYTRLDWGGGVGGPRWGAGVASFIKLLANSKTQNIEEMAGILDHIYDLQHNTGALLNKGGMYVSPGDLDRRSKVTSLTRYFKNVSPLIQRLILRVLPYVSPHPEIDKNPESVTKSPIAPMPPEAAAKLTANKFVKGYGDDWKTQAPFLNKQGGTIQNSYTAKYHTNGMYSVQDDLDTDVEVFETLPEFETWLGRNSPNFITPTGQSYYSVPQSKSELDTFFAGKTKIKLDAEKETILLNECKMVWRPYQNHYKANLPGDTFKFYAFSDGTFMGYIESTNKIGGTFTNWLNALGYCKAQTSDALALSADEYAKGKAYIGAPIGAVISTPPSAPSGPPPLPYALSPSEISLFNALVNIKGKDKNITLDTDKDTGMTQFFIPYGSTAKNVFSVGKKALIGSGGTYLIQHYVEGQNPEEWSFSNFNQAYSFIQKNLELLLQSSEAVKDKIIVAPTPPPYSYASISQEVPLPPPSPSKATYKAHLGIAKPPTHTIRLTQEDEDLLKGVGFAPQMQGGDVWYVHNKTHDVVKIFPNDQAKIIFPQGNTQTTVTKKIDDAIAWIVSKYTGATVSPIVAKPEPSTKGAKAGMLYEKSLIAAGFKWYEGAAIYQNDATGDTIKIFPYPQSTYTNGSTKQTKHFNSLPELAVFVKSLPKP